VKEARKNRNISQLEFAMNVGFNSVSFYCDCENNKNAFTRQFLGINK
jgi:transcriptional regulator with XRE-family HTH domain